MTPLLKRVHRSVHVSLALLCLSGLSYGQKLITKTGTAADANVIAATNVSFGNMLGVALQWKNTDAVLEFHIQKAKDLGAKYVRVDMDRNTIGWNYGRLNFIINKTRTLGLNVIFIVMNYNGGPGYVANGPDLASEYFDYGDYMKFFQDAVKTETHVFAEYWNEANYELFWGGSAPNPEHYRRLLDRCLDGVQVSRNFNGLSAANTIKGISSGVISNVWNEGAAGDFVAGYLKNGTQTTLPNTTTMNYIGFHPYFWSQGKAPERRKALHDSLVSKRNAKGDTRPFAVTEFGYPSTMFNAAGNTEISDNGIDVKLNFPGWEAVARNRQGLLNQRQALIEWAIGTPIACYHTMIDGNVALGTYNHLYSEENFGLLDINANPKPAWHRLRDTVTMTAGFAVQGICKLEGANGSDVWAIKFRNGTGSIVRYALWVANRSAYAEPVIRKAAGKKLRQLTINAVGAISIVQTLNGSTTAATETSHPISEDDGVRWFEISNL